MADTAPDPHEQSLATTNVEPSDIGLKGVLVSMGILVLVIGLTCWGVWILFWVYDKEAIREDRDHRNLATVTRKEREQATLKQVPLDARLPRKPRLEGLASPPAVGNPLPLVQKLKPTEQVGQPIMSGGPGWPSLGPEQAAAEEKKLAKLDWVNEKEGIVRLPIETVMKELVGSKALRCTEPPRDRGDSYRTPTRANSGRPPTGGKP